MQAHVMVAQSDPTNSKCHIQSALSLQPGAGPSSQLGWYPTAETKVTNVEHKKKQVWGEGGGGGWTVSDPAVSASGTHFAGTQGVLSDGRTAAAVFRNTSRPVYCLGAWVSALEPPPPPLQGGSSMQPRWIPLRAPLKLAPPGTRWNSKQNKLFLTWLYWAFPSSYIKKKERRQNGGKLGG